MTKATAKTSRRAMRWIAATAGTIAAIAAIPTVPALAEEDPAGCTQNVQYDPSIPTFKQWANAQTPPVTPNELGGFATGTTNRHPTAQLYGYMDAVAAATAGNPRVRAETRTIGQTNLGKQFRYVVVSTPDNIANLDSGRNDAAFWRGVREGTISGEAGAAQAEERPAFFWNSATPHGNEPAAGEAILRVLYELTARTDCANQRRLENLDNFLMPARNPDGRDNNGRTSAYGFDPNRDFASRNQDVNQVPALEVFKYPSPVFIDAHQQTSLYFFPPNEDPILHEISNFASNLIQDTIGPALQERLNDQSTQYFNYSTYDLFAVVFGDTVPALQLGAAGMTYEKGANESYGKQVYDHYLAMDETMNVISDDKDQIMRDWSAQWEEAIAQGAAGELEENELVSPLNATIIQQPDTNVFGYYYLPNNHSGDLAKLVREMVETGVHVYRLDQAVTVPAAHTFGPDGSEQRTLPAGTLYIPMDQAQKHWIQGILGEDPFIPVPFFYDVVNWSFSHMRGMSGNGYLTQAMPGDPAMTEIFEADFGTVTDGAKPVLAFPTDSAQGVTMLIDLLRQGVSVSRAETAFTAGGKSFPTGAALVDTTTLGAVDIAAISDQRQVPVTGLDSYPVARKALVKPKIGLYTNATTEPSNPLRPAAGNGTGYCPANAYCEALNALSVQLKIPTTGADPVIYPITTTDLAAGRLVNENFTAFINPGSTIAAGAGATALQTFVNQGGRYLGSDAGGTTSARNAGFTTLNTVATNQAPFNDQCYPSQPSTLQTPGTVVTADYDESNPVSWGFDNGNFIYRNANANPVFNPATLDGANVPVNYDDPLVAFGYSCNATGPGELAGRPVVVDKAFGAGHWTVIGANPWYRSWVDQTWRLALNGALYPTGESLPGPAPRRVALRAENEPLAKSALPKVSNRPVIKATNKMDARIVVLDERMKVLKRIVRLAEVPKAKRKAIRFVDEGKYAVAIARKAWTPGADIDEWLTKLGMVATATKGADTNIPGRTH